MAYSIKNRFILMLAGLLVLLLATVGVSMYLSAKIDESSVRLQENIGRLAEDKDRSSKDLERWESVNLMSGNIRDIRLLEERFIRTRDLKILQEVLTRLFVVKQWIKSRLKEEAPRDIHHYRFLQVELTEYEELVRFILDNPDCVIEDEGQPLPSKSVVRISELQNQASVIWTKMRVLENRNREQIALLHNSITEVQKSVNKIKNQISDNNRQRSYIIWGMVAVLVLISVFAGVFIQQTLLSPILSLTKFARKIGGGKYGITCTPPRSKELGHLAETVNEMSLRIQQDITEQEHAKDILRRKTAEQETLLANIPASVFFKDTRGRYVSVNEAFHNMLPKTCKNAVGKRDRDIFPAPLASRIEAEDRNVMETGEIQTTEQTVRTRNGKRIEALTKAIPVKDESGKIVGVIGIAMDITERKRAEEALHENQEWLSTTLRSIGDAVIATDTDACVTFMNPIAEKLTGWRQEEAAGRSIDEVFNITNDGTGNKAKNPVKQAMREGVIIKLAKNTVLIARDGTKRFIDDSAAPIVNAEGNIIGAILTFQDISDRKAMENQLVHSEKMASIGQLAAGVAHEINNPTGFVASNLHTLSEYAADMSAVLKECWRLLPECEGLGGSAGEIAEKAGKLWKECDVDYILEDLGNLVKESIEGTERIKKIVADLKDFSRSDEQKAEEIDINEAIEKTLNVAWNEIKYKAEVQKEYGELPRVQCISGQIDQAILNILVNAAHAIKEKGTITIKTYEKGENVCIEISDTGEGIPLDIQGKIFDPFFTTKPIGKGTGLGLNITYNIIKQHNGDITVRSKPGEGATFTISLPVRCSLILPDEDGTDKDATDEVRSAHA